MVSKLRKTTEEFIRESSIVHNNYYSYPNTVYLGSRNLVLIECPVHGEFSVRAGNHSTGIRCRKCNEGNPLGVFTRNSAIKNEKEWSKIPALLYFLKISSSDESFYKVGTTYNLNIKNRLKEFPRIYDIEVLLIEESDLYRSVISECNIKEDMLQIKYKPKKNFRGKEECFMENPLDYYYCYQLQNQEEYEYKN